MKTIDEVMAIYPDLTPDGFVSGTPRGRMQTPEELRVEQEALRGSVLSVEKTRAWIRATLTPRQTYNPDLGSYGLKHIIERDTGYITNGTCIVAMILEGYRVKRYRHGPSCCFNVSSKFKAPKISG